MDFLGFEIKRKTEEPTSFVPKMDDEGAVVVEGGGVYGTYVDMDGSIRTEAELVNKYRDMSGHPEVDEAITHIVNDAICQEPETKVVELVLDDLEQPEKIKKMLIDEFDGVLKLLEFNSLAYEVFKRWYIDGRLYYHAIIDEQNPKNGIVELRYIDPRKIRKIKEVKKKRTTNNVVVQKSPAEYYIYNEKGFSKIGGSQAVPSQSMVGIKISKDSIIHCTSGLTSVNGDLVQSYLQKAIRPLNQLRSMEDSLVIYRISRAPERRIFYIDVGGLPKPKAEQYLKDIMNRFKNKVVYDAASGEIKNDKKYMTMLEDFWLPRRSDGKGTEITTLPGGQNLSSIDDIIYFQKKLFKSLSVPVGRLDPETQFNFGRNGEITRDEVAFSKFIDRLRNKFASLFTKILERQLILKGIITPEDWEQFKDVIKYKFAKDNYYAELKETEILRDRIAMLRDIDDYAGKYYSHEWIRRNVLKQSDEEIEEIDEQVAEEMNNPQYFPPEEGMDPDGGAPENAGVQSAGPPAPKPNKFPAPQQK